MSYCVDEVTDVTTDQSHLELLLVSDDLVWYDVQVFNVQLKVMSIVLYGSGLYKSYI